MVAGLLGSFPGIFAQANQKPGSFLAGSSDKAQCRELETAYCLRFGRGRPKLQGGVGLSCRVKLEHIGKQKQVHEFKGGRARIKCKSPVLVTAPRGAGSYNPEC